MRVMVTGRAGGKTHAVLAWLARDPAHRVVVCMHRREADRLLREARERFADAKFTRLNFIAYDDALSGVLRGRSITLAVDNADLVLANLFGNVQVASFTGEHVLPGELE